MFSSVEIPPTAGLPMLWQDWLPTKRQLTDDIAQLFNLPPLILECSGTACLIVALKTLAKMPENSGRNEVIIPAYNCPLVVLAVVHCGLTPRLCDTAINHFDFDFDCLEKLLSEKTLCVLPTHIGGQLANVQKCYELAHSHGAYVIEDGAQALGSSAGKIGDIAFFSLAVGKGLTLFEGGLLTSKDAKLCALLQQTHNEIVPKKPLFELKRIVELFGYYAFYRPSLLPLIYGAGRRKELEKGNLEEAVGDVFDVDIAIHRVSKFRARRGANAATRLKDFLKDTAEQAEARIEHLEKIGNITILKGEPDQTNVWPFLSIIMPDKKSRDNALKTLWMSPYGVTRLFIHSLKGYDYLAPLLGNQMDTPNADDLANKMLTISNSLWLPPHNFELICETLQKSI